MYSTCTITMEENEKQVEWALRKFPCLKLVAQVMKFCTGNEVSMSQGGIGKLLRETVLMFSCLLPFSVRDHS